MNEKSKNSLRRKEIKWEDRAGSALRGKCQHLLIDLQMLFRDDLRMIASGDFVGGERRGGGTCIEPLAHSGLRSEEHTSELQSR